MSQKKLEPLIEAASMLKDAVTRLGAAYELMPEIIEKEHRAIRATDLRAVAAITEEKTVAGERIETCFADVMRAGERVAAMTSDDESRPRTLSEFVATLRRLADAEPQDGLAAQVLRHQVDGLAHTVDEFQSRFSKVKPLIEANKELVNALLRNVQESYRFWQEVAEQVSSAYNAQGVQKAAGRNSGFAVKA